MKWLTDWWSSPWRKPRVLALVTVLYLAWSLVPVLIAGFVMWTRQGGRGR